MNTTPFTGTAAQRLRASQLAQSRLYFGRVYRASDPKWTGAERGITDTISNSAVSRRTVYGRALLGTISAYAETTGASNEVLHLIQVLCEGPIDSIETVYFDGEEVTFDGSGNVTGTYAGAAVVKAAAAAAGVARMAAMTSSRPRAAVARPAESGRSWPSPDSRCGGVVARRRPKARSVHRP
jgi:hypothetical protein